MRKKVSSDLLAYYEIVDVVLFENPEVPHHHKVLYLLLLRFENIVTLKCYPCQDTIALHLKTCSRSISIWGRELEMMDWLRIRKIPWKGKTKNVYDLYMPLPNSRFVPLPVSSRKGKKVVLYPSQEDTNSTPSTTLQDGATAYMSDRVTG
jgi:hypothetical protein